MPTCAPDTVPHKKTAEQFFTDLKMKGLAKLRVNAVGPFKRHYVHDLHFNHLKKLLINHLKPFHLWNDKLEKSPDEFTSNSEQKQH